jgi:hypothetical protein
LSMHWGTVAGAGWVKVQETVTVGGCSITTSNYAVTITDIPNPLVTGKTPVCLNETATYRTAKVGSHFYTWSLPTGGGVIVGSNTLDSVVVNWTSSGNYSVNVAEQGSSTVNYALPITVNPLPASNNAVDDAAVCIGNSGNIIVRATAAGVTYQLRLLDDTNVGGSVSSGPGGDVTLTDAPVSTTTYKVYAINEYNCSVDLTDHPIITVNPLPTPSFTSGPVSTCENSAGNIYSTQAGMTNYTWVVSGGTITSGGTVGDNTVTVTWGASGTGHVTINYTDGNGCTAASATDRTVSINTLPSPTFTAGPISACENSTGNVYTTQVGMTNYTWVVTGGSVTGGGTVTDNTVTVTWGAAGTGHVTINYTNASGCAAASATDRTVTINPLPTPSLSGTNDVCEAAVVVYTTAATGNTFNWSVDGGVITANGGSGDNTATITWSAVAGTSYNGSVTVTETTGASCSATSTYNVTIHRIPQTGPQYHILNSHNQ